MYASDGADNLTTVRGALTPVNDDNQLTANTYDGDGNPTTYNGSAVTFDIEDRLTATSVLTVGYYDDGTRAWKQPVDVNLGTRTYFLYEGGHLAAEINATGALKNLFGWGPAGLDERSVGGGGTSYSYTYDPAGNLVMRHQYLGDAACDYTTLYDAFGAQFGCMYATTGIQAGRLLQDMVGYGGQWGYYTDQETAPDPAMLHPGVRYPWVRNGLRDYDSQACRWLERDPISYEGGINVYSFCQNNPITKVDPSGQDVYILIWDPTGGVGGLGYGGHAGIAVDDGPGKIQGFDFWPALKKDTEASTGAAYYMRGRLVNATIMQRKDIDFFKLVFKSVYDDSSNYPTVIIRIKQLPEKDKPLLQWLRTSLHDPRWSKFNGVSNNCAHYVAEALSSVGYDLKPYKSYVIHPGGLLMGPMGVLWQEQFDSPNSVYRWARDPQRLGHGHAMKFFPK